MYKNFIKRILDIILSFLALVILSPLLILTAFLIRIKLGEPVFLNSCGREKMRRSLVF